MSDTPDQGASVTLLSTRDVIAQAVLRAAARIDTAMSFINGGKDAQRLMAAIREGGAPADALLDGLAQVLQLGDPERTRGFLRELQKALEPRA